MKSWGYLFKNPAPLLEFIINLPSKSAHNLFINTTIQICNKNLVEKQALEHSKILLILLICNSSMSSLEHLVGEGNFLAIGGSFEINPYSLLEFAISKSRKKVKKRWLAFGPYNIYTILK